MPFFLSVFLMFLLVAAPASATTVEEALAGCYPAASFSEAHYPGEKDIARTNNLRREAGSPFNAGGTPIFVKGKILDEHCQPVTGAKIDMWQADSDGKLVTEKDGEDFLGAGRTYSNNLGEYSFITILPGIIKGEHAPYLNIGVSADKFSPLYTRMYFPDNADNAKDAELQKADKASKPYGVKYEKSGSDVTYIYNIRMVAGEARPKEDEESEENNDDTAEAVSEDESAPEASAEDVKEEVKSDSDTGTDAESTEAPEKTIPEPAAEPALEGEEPEAAPAAEPAKKEEPKPAAEQQPAEGPAQ